MASIKFVIYDLCNMFQWKVYGNGSIIIVRSTNMNDSSNENYYVIWSIGRENIEWIKESGISSMENHGKFKSNQHCWNNKQ
jgi:hypothetical protein